MVQPPLHPFFLWTVMSPFLDQFKCIHSTFPNFSSPPVISATESLMLNYACCSACTQHIAIMFTSEARCLVKYSSMIHDVDPSEYSMYTQSINFPLSGAVQLQEVMCMVTVAE